MSTLPLPEQVKSIAKRAQCVFSSQQVEQALIEMAKAIDKDLHNENPVVLCVLIGGVVLTGKLLTLLDFPLQVDYIHASRYGNKIIGDSHIEWVGKPRVSLKDRAVLIVDDILDRGITLASIVDFCHEQGAKSIKTAVLVEKQIEREPQAIQKADYTGVMVENRYVYGYGMDYKSYLRNAPGIYMVAPEDE